ncbi:MAG: HEAT repeat domain-containing protein, partial [Planctomycetaceae bacterium]
MTIDDILTRLRLAQDEIERTKAVEELSQYQGEQVIWALIDALGDNDQLVQVAAADVLKKYRPDPAPYLRVALRDTRPLVRWGVAELLAYYASAETEAALRSALADQDPSVRGAAARSLRSMVTESSTVIELRKLLQDLAPFPRYQALLTMRAFDPELTDEAAIIKRDLDSNDPPTCVAAIHFI